MRSPRLVADAVRSRISGWFLFSFVSTILPVMASFMICGGNARAEDAKKPTVYVQRLTQKEIHDKLTYPVKIVALASASILAEGDGVIQRIFTPLGHAVKKNQPVISLKNSDPSYEYANMMVNATIHGVIASMEVTEGSRVVKGQKLATIIDPNKIKGVIEIVADDLAVIRAGTMGTMTIVGTDHSCQVRVDGVSPLIDVVSGTAAADLSILAADPRPWVPGGVGRVVFNTHAHLGFTIPESAVIYRGTDSFLRVVKGSRANVVPVTLGTNNNGNVEILSGVRDGDLVVTRSSMFVGDGEEVTVQDGPLVSKK